MAGNIGSPLCAELNRIANNGVYPDRDDFLEEQGAANVWAGTTGLGLLGALNYIVDPTRTDNNYKGLTAVCNELAGTTGLSDVDALRTINHAAEVLLRGTTPQSAVFTTDAATPRYNYPGYIYLNGTQWISTPDATALDVTGDIDLRTKVAMDDWTPAATTYLLSKYQGSSMSYALRLSTDGTLRIEWSADGTTILASSSTVATGITDGAVKWVRATLDVNNGASGNTATFFTSDDGSAWTQLGSAVVTAGTTSIFNSTNVVDIGGRNSGSNLATGKFYNAQIFASLDGTDKRLDVDLTTNVTSATYDQFTATTGQLCTILGQNTLTNMGKAGSLLPVTVGSSLAADSNDAKFLAHDGTNYVYLPGVALNNLSVPDSAALDITGDIDIRTWIAMDDWTPASSQGIMGKGSSYFVWVLSTGIIRFYWSADGTNLLSADSTVATGITDGTAKWIRVTLDVNNGASGRDIKFWLSNDNVTYTQLGTTVTQAGVTSIFAGTEVLEIGTTYSIHLAGKVYRTQIYSDITGTTKVLDVDTSVITTGAATSFTAVTGQTVTINRSTSGRKTVAVTQPTWLFGTDDYMEVNNRYMAHSTSDENYVYLSGASGNYMSVADNPPLDITGDLDLQVKVALDDWTPSANNSLIYKWDSAGTSASYGLRVNATSGVLIFLWTENGSTVKTATSTVAPTVTDGSALWIRATLDVNNGASGNTVTFYTSTDGTNWTQLGSAITTAGVTSIFSGTGPLEIGSFAGGLVPAKGKFYRAIIKNGIDGTTVLDANAATITLPSQTTFTDSSSNAYTVTINKSGVGTFVSTGNYLYLPGVASNNATAPDSAALDITGDIDLRVKVALDDWTPSAYLVLMCKELNTSLRSYRLGLQSNGTLQFAWSANGTTEISSISTVAPTVTDGGTLWVRATLDVDNGAAGNDTKFFTSTDGLTWTQLGTTVTKAGTTSIYASTSNLEIGTFLGGSSPARGKVFRAQVLNGIGGTLAFDANFEGSITSLNQASFTESSSNAATVTINRSGSTYRSAGVIDAGYLYPGATNTFSNSTIDYLNFGANQDFTLVTVSRIWGVNSSTYSTIIGKQNADTNEPGYGQTILINGSTVGFAANDGASRGTAFAQAYTSGGLNTYTSYRTGSTLAITRNAATPTTATGSTNSISNFRNMRIASAGEIGSALYTNMEFYGAAVFRSVLTPKNIADIYNYFNGRD